MLITQQSQDELYKVIENNHKLAKVWATSLCMYSFYESGYQSGFYQPLIKENVPLS